MMRFSSIGATARKRYRPLAILLFFILALGAISFLVWKQFFAAPGLRVESSVSLLPADGREHVIGTLRARRGPALQPSQLSARGVAASSLRLENAQLGRVNIMLRTSVQPGKLRVSVSGRGGTVVLPVTLVPDNEDRFGDGTPDWMRLHNEPDQQAFRRWFTELAERAADDAPDKLPAEINDCASLLRYAYREALHAHDDKWYAQFPPEAMPALASVQQWSYPNTPLGAGLFRTRPGTFRASDITDGAFAQFADAKTLLSANAHLIGRDVHSGRPGDLIFYRQLERDSLYHSMILTGERSEWVVYHTGPIDKHRGEMRRVLLADLLRHPDPRWRPEQSNPNFLGVYRWNILR